jgi:hypothetical protein
MAFRVFLTIALLAVTTFAQNQGSKNRPPSQPPEVNQTVAAMSGTWLGRMTAKVSGFPAETFDWSMSCQVVAQGAGLLCSNKGTASIGSMTESCLLAFDPEGKAVHYMCVTSMGEVHDHKGKWIDAHTIKFEPLRAGMMGKPITETLEWRFPEERTIVKTSDVKLADGTSMYFEFNGTRQ